MRRRQRTQLLIEGDRKLAASFAQEIENNYSIQQITPPQQALTMVKMRETAQQSLFYLGEVLVTECKVQVNDAIGIGVVIGIEEQLAYELAVVDAAYQAQLPETTAWKARLLEAERYVNDQQAKREAALNKTKVRFETMEV